MFLFKLTNIGITIKKVVKLIPKTLKSKMNNPKNNTIKKNKLNLSRLFIMTIFVLSYSIQTKQNKSRLISQIS